MLCNCWKEGGSRTTEFASKKFGLDGVATLASFGNSPGMPLMTGLRWIACGVTQNTGTLPLDCLIKVYGRQKVVLLSDQCFCPLPSFEEAGSSSGQYGGYHLRSFRILSLATCPMNAVQDRRKTHLKARLTFACLSISSKRTGSRTLRLTRDHLLWRLRSCQMSTTVSDSSRWYDVALVSSTRLLHAILSAWSIADRPLQMRRTLQRRCPISG